LRIHQAEWLETTCTFSLQNTTGSERRPVLCPRLLPRVSGSDRTLPHDLVLGDPRAKSASGFRASMTRHVVCSCIAEEEEELEEVFIHNLKGQELHYPLTNPNQANLPSSQNRPPSVRVLVHRLHGEKCAGSAEGVEVNVVGQERDTLLCRVWHNYCAMGSPTGDPMKAFVGGRGRRCHRWPRTGVVAFEPNVALLVALACCDCTEGRLGLSGPPIGSPQGNTMFFDCGWALFGNRAAEKQRRRGEGVY